MRHLRHLLGLLQNQAAVVLSGNQELEILNRCEDHRLSFLRVPDERNPVANGQQQ